MRKDLFPLQEERRRAFLILQMFYLKRAPFLVEKVKNRRKLKKLQAWWRGEIVRKLRKEEFEAMKDERYEKAVLLIKKFLLKKTKRKRSGRGVIRRRKVHALRIQRTWRGIRAKRKWRELKSSQILISYWVRRFLRRIYGPSVLRIQRWWRNLKLLLAVKSIQRGWREHVMWLNIKRANRRVVAKEKMRGHKERFLFLYNF